MPTISLAPYSLRLRPRYHKDYLCLHSFRHGHDLYDEMTAYFTDRRSTVSHNEQDQRLLKIERLVCEGRRLCGIVQTGNYGMESELYNVDQDTIVFHAGVHDANLLPFYFCVAIPQTVDEALVALQRTDQYGIKKVLSRDFTSYFKDRFPDLIVEMNPLVPDQLIQGYLGKGRITKVRFIKRAIPSDVASLYGKWHEEQDVSIELRVTAKRRGTLRLLPDVRARIPAILKGASSPAQFAELRPFEPDNVKIELELGGRSRTVNLGNPKFFRSTFDVTQSVMFGEGGHPEFESIDAEARDLISDLYEQMGVDVSV